MAYINPKLDYKEGDILYGSDLNASNLVIKQGVDDNYDKIKDIEVFNTELDTDITNLEGALEENVTALEQSIADNVTALEQSIADNVTALEQSIADNLEKIEALEGFTTDLESDINTLASGATPIATKHTRGFVQVGDNLNVDSNGVISGKDPYVLPIATDNVIGGVSIGANIDTDGNGKISVKGVKGSDNISVVEQDGNYHIAYTGGNFKKEIVEELPPVGEDDVIYLLRKDTESGSDIYDEYLWIDGVWNPIGSTDVDLANYYDKATVDEKLDAKADKDDVGGKEVFVSSTQPSDTSMQIWIDESEDGSTFDPTSFYKKEETDELLEELDTTLTEYIDTAISELDLDLPIASSEILGGIKVGENLEIDENGILSAISGVKTYITGTAENPINLYELDEGIYVCSGSYRQNDKSNVTTFDYNGTVIFKAQQSCWGIATDYASSITFFLYLFYGAYQPNAVVNTPTKYRYCQPVNNLTSNDTYKPLSAAQGKVLKDLIDGLNHIPLLPASPTNKIYLTELPIGVYLATSPLYWTPNSTTSFESSSGPALYIKHEENKVYCIFLKNDGFNCYYSDNITSKSKKSLFIKKPTDNLTSTSTSTPLSANQGKVLKGLVDDLQTQINNLPTGGGGEVNYITAIHSNKDKFIEDLEVGKLYYLTGNWYYKKDNTTGSTDVNFGNGYIGYVTEPYTNDFRFEGICFESAFGIKTIEILDIYGSPSSMYGRVREPADNLTTDYGDIALSARQGMVLNNKITTLENKTKTLGENFIDSSSITLTESFENFSEIDVYLHNEDKTIEEKVTIVNPRQSYLAYEKVISHVDLGVFYMLEYFINYDSTTTLSVTGNTGKAIDDTVTTVTSADMPTLYIGKVVGR